MKITESPTLLILRAVKAVLPMGESVGCFTINYSGYKVEVGYYTGKEKGVFGCGDSMEGDPYAIEIGERSGKIYMYICRPALEYAKQIATLLEKDFGEVSIVISREQYCSISTRWD